MKEKRHKEKKHKKHKRRKSSSESEKSSDSGEWVEKQSTSSKVTPVADREEWMSMTGILKTYTKEDVKSKQPETNKKHIDSYNPATSSRELNPYWKDGGTGVPLSPSSYRKSRTFLKPSDDDDYYSSTKQKETYVYNASGKHSHTNVSGPTDNYNSHYSHKTSNWRRGSEIKRNADQLNDKRLEIVNNSVKKEQCIEKGEKPQDKLYLSNEKMNKLAAKIVKAEIMGDMKMVEELKIKLEAAREYRKQNPDAGEIEEDKVLLMSTNSAGNSRPLAQSSKGDSRSKGGKRKADTHDATGRIKYFGDDDKYNLAQMFQQEKYGNNYDNEAEMAKIASKHKNPNDDLEDIFMDEISKNKNECKDSEREKQRAINQHVKLERSLEGCEYCIDSRNMLKHLMVSCGNKVYMALPARKSLVKSHCIITTIQHSTSVTAVDEDIWEEILNYRKMITQFFNSQKKDVVFFETAIRLHKFPHMIINCVPLPRDVGDMASIYFKKALLECEAEWSMNKKVVELKGKDIRKGIPKGLPYFWVDFGMDAGFAHVIEDQQLFPKSFAEEIIGGMLDLDHQLWKNPQREYGDVQRKKVIDFLQEWKPFEQSLKT